MRLLACLPVLVLLVAAQCGPTGSEAAPLAPAALPTPAEALAIPPARADTAIFAGGCFWCMEGPFEKLPGVGAVISGYIGGTEVNPTYAQVSSGRTGHTEAVLVLFDRSVISYETLLRTFWHNIDPFSGDGQFCDRGRQYRPGVFYRSAEQRRLALASRATLQARFGRPLATEVTEAGWFYPAEAYHQDYYRREPARYQQYRQSCGRDARLQQLWGDRAGIPGDAL